MITTKIISNVEMEPFIEQFHIYGHGIQNGVDEAEHLWRIKQECSGLIGLLVLRNDKPIGLVTLLPNTIADSHFPGTGIMCIHIDGRDFGVSGVRAVKRTLRELCLSLGDSWYSMSSRVSKYEYRNRYYPVEKIIWVDF